MCSSDDIADAAEVVAREVVVDAVNDFHGDSGVDEVGGANLHSSGAGEDKLDGIGGVHDAAEAHDGDLHRIEDLPYHAQRHGLHGRTGEAAGADAEDGLAPFGIDGHAHEGVDE